ncbi:protein kinase domain-containing protein, partial [Mycobacterium sp.]|uniref:serine/threonine-protein kinase n=1 Tax=Mycobacterium sp. TaxID=1785 RepID=UPI003C762045
MSDAQASRLGTMFGPYYLKRLLGRGGMGEVYEAEHTVKHWTVALKLVPQIFSQDPVFRKRMEREARITGRLLEPHVVPIHDYGEIDGQLFLEMRLIEGTDLGRLLEQHGPLTTPRAVAIVEQIASALDTAHAAGVTHRDIKPQNIPITHDDFAYLADFGIASARTDEKLTQLGTAVGTWKYMAPERFSHAEVTHRADIYALACVLYECLTATSPYRADDNTGGLITAHMMEPIPRPSEQGFGVPQAFDAVIARGMAKNSDDRYASAGALAAAAHDALSGPDRDQAQTIVRLSGSQPNPAALAHTASHTPFEPVSSPGTHAEPSSSPQPVPAPLAAVSASESAVLPTGGELAGTSSPVPATEQDGPPSSPRQQPNGAVPDEPRPSRQRKRRPIVAAVAVLIVAAVSVVGIWLMMRPSGDRGKASVGNAAPPASPAPSDAQARLLSLLPPGYVPGACTPATPEPGSIWVNAVAMVSCGQNNQPGGPTHATYGLFPTPDNLKKAFNDDIAHV